MPPRLFLLQPEIVLRASVNAPSISYPVDQIPFDNVTDGDTDDLRAGMTVVLTNAAGTILGRQRLRKPYSTTNALDVGRSSQGTHDGELWALDNATVTVYDDYRVWSKPPKIVTAGDVWTEFKDSDIEVGDYGSEPPPVCNIGTAVAATIDPDTDVITVDFDASGSYAVADDATIDSYSWEVGDGTVTDGTLTTQSLTVTFPAGFRWVACTVTDSNDKTHTARIPVFARDPDDDACIAAIPERQRITPAGQEVAFRILEDIPADTYPDGTLAIYFDGEPSDSSDRSNVKFVGWHQSDEQQIGAGKTGTLKDTVLTCVDVAGRLASLRAYAVSVENEAHRDSTKFPVTTWAFMSTPNMDKLVHHILHWHTTALEVADFTPSGTGSDYPFLIMTAAESNIYDQVNRLCQSMIPDYWLTCSRRGALQMVVDPMLQQASEREYSGVDIDESDYSDIRVTGQRPPRIYELETHAILATTGDTLTAITCRAPGDAPGQGLTRMVRNESLARSQSDLNGVEGRRYARLNAPHTHFALTLADPSVVDDLEIADMQTVQLKLPSTLATQRGLSLDNELGLVHEMTIRYQVGRTGLVKTVDLVWERAVTATNAVTVPAGESSSTNPPDDGDYWPPGWQDDIPGGIVGPIPAPDFGLVDGVETVALIDANGKLYTTTDFQTASGDGGPTWVEHDLATGETDHYSFVVDPFSPGYRGVAGGGVNGWIATTDKIIRVEDFFGTPAISTAHTFDNSADGSSFHWRTIGCSFGRYFPDETDNPWLICVSHYGDTSGHSGTWATYSTDGGQTWSDEVQIAPGYDSGTATRFAPIGLWMSPRTPGLAYAAAYELGGDPPSSAVYATEDWGATWSKLALDLEEDPDQPLPRWINTIDGVVGVVTGAQAGNGSFKRVDQGEGFGGFGPAVTTVLVPPCNVARIELEGAWSASVDGEGTHFHSTDIDFEPGFPLWWDTTHDFSYTAPPDEGESSGTFSATIKPRGGNQSPDSCDLDYMLAHIGDWTNTGMSGQAAATISGDGVFSQSVIGYNMTITEIELQDGTTYTPPSAYALDPINRLAGTIHVPWPGNDDESIIYHGAVDLSGNIAYSLKRVVGGVAEDISPNDGTRDYGPNRGPFAVRTYDGDRSYVLLAGVGNDGSTDHDDDMHGVWVSEDGGDTWTNIVTPIADSGAPTNRPAFAAAFGGDSQNVIFIWGPPDYISYSEDMGDTVDDRSGNLSTDFTLSGALGIAGGATS